jgi:hypothetical protein
MELFKKELADLLRKHHVYIVARGGKNDKSLDREVGFQKDGKNEWQGRSHLGGYDIDGKQSNNT